jgi:hypothetical protein
MHVRKLKGPEFSLPKSGAYRDRDQVTFGFWNDRKERLLFGGCQHRGTVSCRPIRVPGYSHALCGVLFYQPVIQGGSETTANQFQDVKDRLPR